jgi:hypothetical protein
MGISKNKPVASLSFSHYLNTVAYEILHCKQPSTLDETFNEYKISLQQTSNTCKGTKTLDETFNEYKIALQTSNQTNNFMQYYVLFMPYL